MKKVILLALLSVSMTFAQTTNPTISEKLVENSEKIKEFSQNSNVTLNNVTQNVKQSSEALKKTTNAVGQVYDDSKTVVGTAYDDGKSLLKVFYDDGKILATKLETGLQSLAEGLKTTSIKAWEILVKQQQVWSWCYLFLTLSSLFLWYKFSVQLKKTQTDLTETSDLKTSNIIVTVLFAFVALLDSVVAGIHFEQMMTGFINPEFGALRTLFELVQTLK